LVDGGNYWILKKGFKIFNKFFSQFSWNISKIPPTRLKSDILNFFCPYSQFFQYPPTQYKFLSIL
jgi:hypothetical protein